MAGLRVELLVVLTGTLLVVGVEGWTRVNETLLFNYYNTGRWAESPPSSDDDGDDYDYGEDEVTENAVSKEEGLATSDNFDLLTGPGLQPEGSDWAPATDGGFQLEFESAAPRSWMSTTSPGSTGLSVVCSDAGFHITFRAGPMNAVKVLGSKDMLSVMDAPKSCGYDVNPSQNTLSVPFTGCHVAHSNGHSLQLIYIDGHGEKQITTASCEPREDDADPMLHAYGQTPHTSKCTNPTTPPPSKAQNCAVAAGERVSCGQSGISASDCEKMGCCVDSSAAACFYPLDECTADQHFVFAIRRDSASIPVDPTKLRVPGTDCKPVIVNDEVAVFKFKVSECGTHSYEVGETKIYLAEVQTVVKALNLKYGIITRSDPLKFMVECRYGKQDTAQPSLASVGYMVKTPRSSLPSAVFANGLYGVQLRIAKDHNYSSYLPHDHQPLRLLLGKPVYLELRLKSPKPKAVILVNYCVAYPRSAKNALVLVYEGCANPNDPTISILQVSDPTQNRHQRRFVVKAFQFMDQKTNKYLDEEIYFMCSAEVCRPGEKTCEETCFDGKMP